MTTAIAHRGPDGEGFFVDGPVGLGHSAARDHRPLAGRAPADDDDRRRRRAHLQRRDLQLPRAPRTSSRRAATASARARDTEVVLHALRASGAPTALDAVQRDVRVRALGRARSASSSSRATATASSRSTTRVATDTFLFGSEIKALLAHPGVPRRARPRALCSSTSPSRTSSPTGPCSKACSCSRRGHHLAVARRRRSLAAEAVLGLRVPRAGRQASTSASTVEELDRLFAPGGRPPARQRRARRLLPQRRHGLRVDHRDRGARSSPTCERSPSGSTCTPRRASSSASTSAQRAEHMSYLFKTEHYEMVLKAGDMERCLPRPRLAPRGAAGRPELSELLRRPARQQVRQGRALREPAATSSSAGIRGATTGRSSTTTSTTTSTSTTASGSDCSRTDELQGARSALDVWREVEHVRHVDIFRDVLAGSRRASSTRPRTTSTTRSTSRPRRSCTACSSSRTSSRWRTASRRACRSSTTTSSTSRSGSRSRLKLGNLADVVRLNENEPGAKTERFFAAHPRREAAAPRRRWRATSPRGHRRGRSRASPAPTRAGSAARASTTSATAPERRRARSTSSSTADGRGLSRTTSREREPAAADLVAPELRALVQDVRRRGRRGAARADRGRGGVLTAPFTRAGFEALLEGALEAGYTFAPFDQVPDVAQVCLLRHDVDADLGAAVELARIEQRVGVQATYFCMLRSPLYNVFGRRNVELVHELVSLGHEIGLHYDVGFDPPVGAYTRGNDRRGGGRSP